MVVVLTPTRRRSYLAADDTVHPQLFIKMDFASEMYELHQQVSPLEMMVGWFATGPEVTDHSVLIHTYYSKQAKCPTPIHLTLDTIMAGGRMSWKAYIRWVMHRDVYQLSV